MIKIAINGFGRIGKTFLRAFLQDSKAKQKIQIAVINTGKGDPKSIDYAFKYDTLMGTYQGNVRYENNKVHIDEYSIDIISELDPEKAPWSKYNIDWVVDCSGKFTKREEAIKHLNAGSKAVLISAPAQSEDITIVPGVNSELFDKKKHKIVSIGSCTTNALIPIIKILHDTFKIEYAFMTTVHAYTNSQVLLDVDPTKKDLRRHRAAALNIVPSTTGAMEVIDKIFPDLSGKIGGCSLRIPVSKVSILDLTAVLNKKVTSKEVNDTFLKASSSTTLNKIVGFTLDPLVSNDFSGDSRSVVIDGLMTQAKENIVKVFGWYDNEWAFSVRMKDFLMIAT